MSTSATGPQPAGAPRPEHWGDHRRVVGHRAPGAGQPLLPADPARLADRAADRMPGDVLAYLAGGAGGGATMRANRDAFGRWCLVPRMLRPTARRDWSTEVLGTPVPAPLLLAPVGAQTVFHPEGEIATARAAAAVGLPFVLSTVASHSLEDVAAAAPAAARWFQLYRPTADEVTRSVLSRARAAGYTVLVVTVDNWVDGWRTAELDRAAPVLTGGHGSAVLYSDPAFRGLLGGTPEDAPEAAAALRRRLLPGDPPTPESLRGLRQWWRGPIVVKGVLHPADALLAVEAGADGVVVSNHGGRQTDRGIGALDALPAVVAAVGDRAAVLMDSGVRSGADVALALALGADAVLLGRPWVYGLALAGAAGVEHVLRGVLAEFDLTLALDGYPDLAALRAGRGVVVRSGDAPA